MLERGVVKTTPISSVAEAHPSPYELCTRVLSEELLHLQNLLAQLRMEDEKLKQTNCIAVGFLENTTMSFDTKCTSSKNSRIEEITETSFVSEEVQGHRKANFADDACDASVRPATISFRQPSLSSRGSDITIEPTDSHSSMVACTSQARSNSVSGMQAARSSAKKALSSSIVSTRSRATAAQTDEAKRLAALMRTNTTALATDEYEEELSYRERLRRMVVSNSFELVFAVAIFTNSLLIGVEVDWSARNHNRGENSFFVTVGFVYAGIFTVELVLRVLASGCCAFFRRSPNLLWNYFDLIIVSVSMYEVILHVLVHVMGENQGGLSGINQMRAARLLRVARLMRFMRIARITRFVEALRTLVLSIIGTLRSLFWSMLLLGLFIYTFATAFTQAATDAVELKDVPLKETELESLLHYWGNLPRSMFTLFASLTGGVSWEVPAWMLEKTGTHMLLLYLVFLVFTYFAVLNVVVAVFVQSATESAQTDQDMIVKRKVAQRRAYIELVHQLFHKVDKNNSGSINYKELQSVFDDEQVQAYFESLEIRVDRAWSLFKLLDADDGQSIDLEEFEAGCLRLRGSARGLDLASLKAEQRHLEKELHEFMTSAETALGKILQIMARSVPLDQEFTSEFSPADEGEEKPKSERPQSERPQSEPPQSEHLQRDRTYL